MLALALVALFWGGIAAFIFWLFGASTEIVTVAGGIATTLVFIALIFYYSLFNMAGSNPSKGKGE